MNSLFLLKLNFTFTVNYDATFPGFTGNTFRGVIGRSLLELFCDKSSPQCHNCPESSQCVYPQVFKADNKSETVTKAPAPYVFEVDYTNKRNYKKGEKLHVSLLLIGSAIRYTMFFVEAMKALSKKPFDGYDNVLTLESVTDVFNNMLVYNGSEQICKPEPVEWTDKMSQVVRTYDITVGFLTPTQLLKNKQLVTDIDFDFFTDSLFSRIADLCEFYGDKEFVLPYNLIRRKPYVVSESKLRAIRVNQQKASLDALLGSVSFRGDISQYMPYICLCELLHIGKLSTRAFGQYKITINDMEEF